MTGDRFRDGIFALRTRRVGAVGEMLVKRLVSLGKAQNQFHDLYDDIHGHRTEVKFCTVLKKAEIAITESTVLKAVELALAENRMVRVADGMTTVFDCNVQQVKPRFFEILYYGLFFADEVMLFRATTEQVEAMPGYSPKQHAGNVGEGQFHITQKN